MSLEARRVIHAVSATNDRAFAEAVSCCAAALGIVVHEAVSLPVLESHIASFAPDIVICDAALGAETLCHLPAQYPPIAWILRLQPQTGWAAAAEYCLSCGFSEILPGGSSLSNIWVALRNTAEASARRPGECIIGENAVHAMRRCQKNITSQILPNRLLPADGPWQGCLSQTHFLALFWNLVSTKASGVLHLRRPGIHWILTMNVGFPFAMDSRDSEEVFGFEAWYEQNGQDCPVDIDARLPSARVRPDETQTQKFQIIHENRRSFEIRRMWLAALIGELFTWPEASFDWNPGGQKTLSLDEPVFAEHDVDEIVADAALARIPNAMILEVVVSALPYFLKLRDNARGVFRMQLPKEARVVLEKLRDGNTLTEMLAMLPQDYPVQRVVYLAAMLDELNWIS